MKQHTTDKYYNQLLQLYKDNPQLTLNNEGYQYLNKDIIESHKNQIKEISDILKITTKGFVEFNNFKISKVDTGVVNIRCQYYWSLSFVGVGYFDLTDFKNFEEEQL